MTPPHVTSDIYAETIAVFDDRAQPVEPLTTVEVAKALGRKRRTVYNRLQTLADRGELRTKSVGANARVWWRPRENLAGHDLASLASKEVLERFPDPATLHDPRDGSIVETNQRFCEMSGYTRQELLDLEFSALHLDEAPYTSERAHEYLERALTDGPQTFEWRDRTKSGESLPVEVNLRSTSLDGEPRILAVVRDLSARENPLQQASQHEVIMELGQRALESGPGELEALFLEACELISDTLDTEFCKVLELLPGGDAVLLRAGVGWRDGLVGSEIVPTGVNSQAGYTLQAEEPVIVDDLRTEDRFTGPELLSSHGVVSGVSVIIGSVEEPWGVLGTHSTERRKFTQQDATFVQNIANILGSAIQSTEAKRDLTAERRLKERIVSTSPVGITVVNDQGELAFANDRAQEILGRRRETIEEFTHDDPRWSLTDEDGEPFADGDAPFERVMKTGEPIYNEEISVRRQDGRRVWLTLNATPLTPEEEDVPSGVIFALTDVTEERRIEAEFEEILGRVTDAFFALDRGFQFTHANERAAELLQSSTDELLGRSVWELFPEAATMETVRTAFEQAVNEQEPSNFVVFYEPLGFWVEANLYPSKTGVSVYFRDVSSRKERENKLEQTLDLLHKTEHIADVGGWEIDPKTRDMFWTDHALELLEYPGSEGPTLEETIGMCEEADRGGVETAFAHALDNAEPFEVEARIETGPDTERWFRIMGVPEIGDGAVTTVRGALQDITERKEHVRSIERFQIFLDHSTDLFTVLNEDGTLDYQSPSSEWILGYDPETLLGEDIIQYIHPEDRARTRKGFERAVENPAAADTIEYRFNHADGSWRWLESSGNNQIDNPAIEGFVVNSRDITERKKYEQYLEGAKDQLEAANEAGAVGTFEWHIGDDRLVLGRSLAEMLGIDAKRARKGVSLDVWKASIHEADRERILAAVNQAIENCGHYQEEYRLRDANDELRWVIARGHVESDGQGKPTSFPGALTDITELKTYERKLESLDRFNETIRRICLGAAEAGSRSEIEQRVCEGLIESPRYLCASIGEAVEGETLQTRSLADATGGFLGTLAQSSDEDIVMEELGLQAQASGELNVISDVAEAAPSWGETALEWGIRSVAAIPLIHEEIPYGVLLIYADRPYAFDAPEGPILQELGDIIAHTIAAIERKAVMMSDEVVEFELLIANVFADLELPRMHDGTITFDRVVPGGDRSFREYGSVTADGVETLRDLAEKAPHIEGVRFLDEHDGPSDELRFEMRLSEPSIVEDITSLGARFIRATIEEGDCQIVVQVRHGADIHRVNAAIREEFSGVTIMAKRHVNRGDERLGEIEAMVTEEMSDRQRTILEAAYFSGYFEWPRETTGQEIAYSFGISPSTASEHLRLAQRNLLHAIYERE